MLNIKLKILLISEAFFFGLSGALTTGLLFVYLTSIGAGVEGISVVVGLSSLIKLFAHLLLYKYPTFLKKKVKLNFIINYGLDRFLLLFIPLTKNYLIIALIYSAAAATPTTAFMNLTIFGSLKKDDIKDVTAKRTAALGVSSILGFALAIFLLAFLPHEIKFFYIFLLGVMIGSISTIIISQMNLSHLEKKDIPKGIKRPEKLYSTSSYFVAVLAGGSLLSMVWIPYLMDYLNGPDYLAVAMNLVITLTSVIASLIFKNWSFKNLRYTVGFDAITPLIALFTPIPTIHPLISAYSSLTNTGSSFIGSFLFAGYNKWLGAIRSSILIVVIACVANVIVAPIGILLKNEYLILFLITLGVKFIAFILALSTIPEVAMIPEETATTYSRALYYKSVTGYRISVVLSKETILLSLKIMGFSIVLLTLYIIYRIFFFMII